MNSIEAKRLSIRPWRILLWGSIPLLLLIPAIGMLLTDEVNWGPEDFLTAAILFGVTALLVDVVVRFAKSPLMRLALVGLVLLCLVLVWAELAVGVFGTPFAGS